MAKKLSATERLTIKGNGFDGLVIGNCREDAEEFIRFINEFITNKDVFILLNDLSGRKVRQAFMTVEEEAYTRGYNEKAMEISRKAAEYH